MSNPPPPEVVGRDSKTQRQVGEKKGLFGALTL